MYTTIYVSGHFTPGDFAGAIQDAINEFTGQHGAGRARLVSITPFEISGYGQSAVILFTVV